MEHSERQWPFGRQAVIGLLTEYGIQPTQQRVDIAGILFDHPQHMSADQVLTCVNKSRPTVSKATVYNTLGLFAEKGLIRQVIVDPNRVFYDSNNLEHHHLYNIDTGKLVDIPVGHLKVEGLPELPHDVVAEGVEVIVRVRNKPTRLFP